MRKTSQGSRHATTPRVIVSTCLCLMLMMAGTLAARAEILDSFAALMGLAAAASETAAPDAAPNGPTAVFGNTCTSTGDTNWSLPTTWLNCGGTTPQAADDVLIRSTDTVVFNVGAATVA